jgi:hypothetical protein
MGPGRGHVWNVHEAWEDVPEGMPRNLFETILGALGVSAGPAASRIRPPK